MENPWLQLPPSEPFVLEAGHPHVEAFNECLLPSEANCFSDLRLHPVPWMGNSQAALVVLTRNPSIGRGDHEAEAQHREYVAARRANIQDDASGKAVVGLLERFRDTPAGDYWGKRTFKAVIERVGPSDELASRVLIVEFHGYRSKEYRAIGITLPSQAYGFELVRKAVRRRATIVILRAIRDWRVAVPELRAYPYIPGRYRNARISPKNLGYEGFERVVAELN